MQNVLTLDFLLLTPYSLRSLDGASLIEPRDKLGTLRIFVRFPVFHMRINSRNIKIISTVFSCVNPFILVFGIF
jgi:hypothetical protein